MSKQILRILFFIGTILSVGSASVGAPANRAMGETDPVHGDLVHFDNERIQVRIDGELVRFQTSRLHSYRVRQGQLHMRLVGGLVLVVSAGPGMFERDTDWVTVSGKSASGNDRGKERSVGPGKTAGSRLKWTRETLTELQAQQREYRMVRDHHKKRMLLWFTEIEQAKRQGSESSALSNTNLFKTRELADAFAGKLAAQIRAVNQIEQLARKTLQTNGDLASVRRCAQALVELEKGHRILAAQGEALDQNLVETYRALQGY